MNELNVGDLVRFKTKAEMEDEFGVDERGVILCDKAFMPWMWEYVEEGKQYEISRIIDDAIFLDGFAAKAATITSDMLVLSEMEMEPIFDEINSDIVLDVEGRTKFDIRHIGALFMNLSIPQDVVEYFDTLSYMKFKSNPRRYKIGWYRNKDLSNLGSLYSDDKFQIAFIQSENYTYENLINARGINDRVSKHDNYTIDSFGAGYYIFFKELSRDDIFEIYNDISRREDSPIIFEEGDNIDDYIQKCCELAQEKGEALNRLYKTFKMQKFVKAIMHSKKEKLEREVKNCERSLTNAESQAVQIAKNLREKKKELAYFEFQTSQDDGFLSLLEEDKGLIDLFESNNNLYFHVVKPLIFFEDIDYSCNKKGSIYTSIASWKQKLLDEIFEHKTITLILEETFQFDPVNGSISCLDYYDQQDNTKGIPNPHHRYANCWGDNTSLIIDALVKGDLSIAYLQSVAAIQGFNLSDGSIWRSFVNQELDDYKLIPCLQIVETGELISIAEYERRNK